MSGFGFSGNVRTLAGKVESSIGSQTRVAWSVLTHLETDLQYLLPTEFGQLKVELKRLGIGIYEENGSPIEAGRKA